MGFPIEESGIISVSGCAVIARIGVRGADRIFCMPSGAQNLTNSLMFWVAILMWAGITQKGKGRLTGRGLGGGLAWNMEPIFSGFNVLLMPV